MSKVSLIKKHSQVAGLKNRKGTFLPFQTTSAQGYLTYCFSSLECVVAWSTPDISFPTVVLVLWLPAMPAYQPTTLVMNNDCEQN